MPLDSVTPVLSGEDLRLLNAWWRAANYIGAAQIFLKSNPLLREPFTPENIKPRLLGHWGTTPGLNFVWTHLNRLIRRHGLDMMFIAGPGHGGAAVLAQTWMEGSFTARHPEITQDGEGLGRLMKQFSWPYGFSSHVDVSTPGAIHFGGELGYSLLHATGAVFDNPDLIVACVVGDGEAETGPCAGSWQSHRFLDPARDGAVLPILHLNGYKIGNPTVLARIPEAELEQYFVGLGYRPHFLSGSDPAEMHPRMAEVLERMLGEIRAIQQEARGGKKVVDAKWPMLVLRTPKGWTGPATIDGKPVENTWRSHQVPIDKPQTNPEHLKALDAWLRSYKPEELFDEQGRLCPELMATAPDGNRRMGMNPHANGGELLRDLEMPAFRDYAVDVPAPGTVKAIPAKIAGDFLRDIIERNPDNFRLVVPDELISNKLDATLEVTGREWEEEQLRTDMALKSGGRVMEVLSEHLLEGWLEGYLLTGRHGLFNSYEAFINIVDSMVNQHAKWLKLANEIEWRKPIGSLNYLLTSHVWQQDHNGFTHQSPGFLDLVANKKPGIARIYLPPDANCLLSVLDHCLRSRNYINVIVAGKQETLQWLTMEEAAKHCEAGVGIWPWAGNTRADETPDVVIAAAGDVPTVEAIAAAQILRERMPELKVRFVNVVDLMTLSSAHPHGLSDDEFLRIFTEDKPVLFAFHGYPALVHQLTSERPNRGTFHVRGYMEEGAATTPFDMTVLNHLDRFSLVQSAIRIAGANRKGAKELNVWLDEKLEQHREFVRENGIDQSEIREWKLSA
ncbi:phosphoketolase [Terriglobus sp.]|uniref:phosphoketolase family protein n=1 Tax=Terriglobus sp. TaxID=1889013 RepID=UPI003B00FBF3